MRRQFNVSAQHVLFIEYILWVSVPDISSVYRVEILAYSMWRGYICS